MVVDMKTPKVVSKISASCQGGFPEGNTFSVADL
jgi:hypothetical protein